MLRWIVEQTNKNQCNLLGKKHQGRRDSSHKQGSKETQGHPVNLFADSRENWQTMYKHIFFAQFMVTAWFYSTLALSVSFIPCSGYFMIQYLFKYMCTFVHFRGFCMIFLSMNTPHPSVEYLLDPYLVRIWCSVTKMFLTMFMWINKKLLAI